MARSDFDDPHDPLVLRGRISRGATLPAPGLGPSAAPTFLRLDDGRQLEVGDALSIGSAADNDLVLEDPYVSAHHCRIWRARSRLMLEDLDSRNGSFVAGARVTAAELCPGVRLLVGQTAIRLVSHGADAGNPLVGISNALKQLRQEIVRVGPTSAAVLLHGETGTGKELAARALHVASGRTGEFIAVNCGAIPAELFESELMGHERGAFTGATTKHAGVFVEADGGTLFLDEIGELPLGLQPKLLRVLETRRVRPIGGSHERPVDVRIIAATHQALEERIAERSFRSDLYHRLATVTLRLVPLRERHEDIPALAAHFLEQLAAEFGPKTLSSEALDALLAHPWPGNVRELYNVLQRGAIFGGTVLQPVDLLLPPGSGVQFAPAPPSALPLAEKTPRYRTTSPLPRRPLQPLPDLQRNAIEDALRQTRGNRRAAAHMLGIPKSTLCDWIRRYEISSDPE